jgi:hypothetical protein
MQSNTYETLLSRVSVLSKRINELSELEANAAMVSGLAADGRLQPQKNKMIDQIDQLLKRLESLIGSAS